MQKYILSMILALCLATAGTAHADCFNEAAAFHGVNPWVLRAIASVESNFSAGAENRNKNGTLDMGMMQINSIHLRELSRYGIRKDDLYHACKSVHVAAWLLRQRINEHGNTWYGIAAYHSKNQPYNRIYAEKLQRTLQRWSRKYDLSASAQ